MTTSHGNYYLPEPSPWPVITSAGLFLMALGAVLSFNSLSAGPWFLSLGFLVIAYMMFRWFGQVISESEEGAYNHKVDLSFRWGMSWFIFSEVMFFAAFFGALFYIRYFAINWIGDTDLLWPEYTATWPTAGPEGPVPVFEEAERLGAGYFTPMGAVGIPLINTIILLSSGVTVTWAHWGLKKENRAQLVTGLFCTVALGIIFLALQAYEYVHAYTELNLTLKAGVYGSTFFMLTGFHGLHVTIGTIMLIVILGRAISGHFTKERHFAFEGVAWYWHFVDVVWLFLFIFVYWV